MTWMPASSVPGESPLLGFQLLSCPHVGDWVRRKAVREMRERQGGRDGDGVGYLWFLLTKALTLSEQPHSQDFHFLLSCIGEGNGNQLQCSCLETPRDGGAWWAAVYGIAQSWTRLKRLSSSSSRTEYRTRVSPSFYKSLHLSWYNPRSCSLPAKLHSLLMDPELIIDYYSKASFSTVLLVWHGTCVLYSESSRLDSIYLLNIESCPCQV